MECCLGVEEVEGGHANVWNHFQNAGILWSFMVRFFITMDSNHGPIAMATIPMTCYRIPLQYDNGPIGSKIELTNAVSS